MEILKVKLIKPSGTDSGDYTGLSSVDWDTRITVEGILDSKALIVKGSEFIRIGGDASVFKPDVDYIWGSYDLIEN
jgi:hypothetical protein